MRPVIVRLARTVMASPAKGRPTSPRVTLNPSIFILRGGGAAAMSDQGENPVVQGREETLPPVGERLWVQVCWAITKPDTVRQYQQSTRAGHGVAARWDLGVIALSVKREPQHVASG